MHFIHKKDGETLLRIVLKQQAFNKRFFYNSFSNGVLYLCSITRCNYSVKRRWRVRDSSPLKLFIDLVPSSSADVEWMFSWRIKMRVTQAPFARVLFLTP